MNIIQKNVKKTSKIDATAANFQLYEITFS